MGAAERPSETLARQVRAWRDRRKLSAQDLANRLADLGAPTLNRRVISKIENGQRGVTLDEWLQLAHALAVPPPLLFLDLAKGTGARIADNAILHPWLAFEWVVGDEQPVLTSREGVRADEWYRARSAINLYRAQRDAAARVQDASSAIRAAEYAKNRSDLAAARKQHAEALRNLAQVLDSMIENGVEPPSLPREWVDVMLSLDVLKHADRVRIFESGGGDGDR